jgi:hypothetical protein
MRQFVTKKHSRRSKRFGDGRSQRRLNMDFLMALENSALATWLRESPSLWAYPTILFLHTVGIGFLAGPSAAIDLRILGVAPDLPLSCMKRFFPVMYFGFWVNAVSGAGLVMVDATKMLTNPYFYVKLLLIALAIVNIQLLKQQQSRLAG